MKTRIITAVVLIPVMLLLLMAAPTVVTAVIWGLLMAIAVYELLYSTGLVREPRLVVHSGIMKLMGKYLREGLRDMEKNRVRIRFFGDLDRLSPELKELCLQAQTCSENYDVQVNFCFNYGGRDELTRAARLFAQDVADGRREPLELTEELLSTYLYSADVPDPELIIRPSGEQRTSNFLLWQSAYSEYVFMNVLWPDFSPADLDAAIAEYHRRNRRFGGV